jgi:hypothetical protein
MGAGNGFTVEFEGGVLTKSLDYLKNYKYKYSTVGGVALAAQARCASGADR